MTDDDQMGSQSAGVNREPCAEEQRAGVVPAVAALLLLLPSPTSLTASSFVFPEDIKVSVNDFVIKAAAVTLKVSIATVFGL